LQGNHHSIDVHVLRLAQLRLVPALLDRLAGQSSGKRGREELNEGEKKRRLAIS
jgi:hypothetical protein